MRSTYIDIFSVILLLSILDRVTAVWLFAKQAAEHAVKLARRVLVGMQRFEFHRSREAGCPVLSGESNGRGA